MKNENTEIIFIPKTKLFSATLGASNHSKEDREENDYYATEPKALEVLLEKEQFNNVWENACGQGHLSRVLEKNNILGKSSDLIDRGYGEVIDFLDYKDKYDGDIITNPPYSLAEKFILKSLDVIPSGNKVAMFFKIQFLEGVKRKKLFENFPPKIIYIFSGRVVCAKNGDFEKYGKKSLAFIWIVWEKGFTGNTIIKWIN